MNALFVCLSVIVNSFLESHFSEKELSLRWTLWGAACRTIRMAITANYFAHSIPSITSKIACLVFPCKYASFR
jgi:hypothetical protein